MQRKENTYCTFSHKYLKFSCTNVFMLHWPTMTYKRTKLKKSGKYNSRNWHNCTPGFLCICKGTVSRKLTPMLLLYCSLSLRIVCETIKIKIIKGTLSTFTALKVFSLYRIYLALKVESSMLTSKSCVYFTKQKTFNARAHTQI